MLIYDFERARKQSRASQKVSTVFGPNPNANINTNKIESISGETQVSGAEWSTSKMSVSKG